MIEDERNLVWRHTLLRQLQLPAQWNTNMFCFPQFLMLESQQLQQLELQAGVHIYI